MTKKQSKKINIGTLVRVKSGSADPVVGIYRGEKEGCIGLVKIADGSVIERPFGQISPVKEVK